MKKLIQKAIKPLAALSITAVCLLAYQNCADYELTSTVSGSEREVILDVPFPEKQDNQTRRTRPEVGSTSDSGDSYQPSFPYANKVDKNFVQRCDAARYKQEKAEVLNMVNNDASNTLIPVRFSISTGNIVDETSYVAYLRSILKADDDGVTEVYVGPKNRMIYRDSHKGVFHYVADHTAARSRYIKGERCFFDVIKVKSKEHHEVRLNGKYHHQWAVLNYGNNYSKVPDEDAFELSPRLFKKIKDQNTPQIIPLYVADIREQYFSFTNKNYTLLNPDFVSSAVRRKEYTVLLRELFFLDRMFKHREGFVDELSESWRLKGKNYAGYEGIPQLFDNIIFGYKGTVLSMQYTPIVIDLGKKHIRTSSLDWGSFFNLANIKVPKNNKGYKRISHQVAWLGGELKQVNRNGEMVWKRVAEDGFLVIPDANGEVHSAEQLFSNKTMVNGRRYENGFKALAVMTDKTCASDKTEDKYIGPWDKAYKTLKIWVDGNRNGYSDKGEILSLKQAGIVALNPCSYNSETSVDQFGNRTRIRSSALYAKDLASASSIDIDEIKTRLFTGKTSSGKKAEFKAMIDIYFRSKPSFYLENIDADIQDSGINNY